MTDPSTLTRFTAIAVRAIGGELWIELDDAPMSLEDAHRLEKRGLIIKTIRRDARVEYVVVKRAANPPGKVLDWRPRKPGVL
jgi:hypothetical protein